LTANQLFKLSKRSWSRLPIQDLDLQGVSGRLGQVLALLRLPQIRRLQISAFGEPLLTEADIRALGDCPRLQGLRTLELLRVGANAVAQAVADCPSLGGLSYLRLEHEKIDDVGIGRLATSANVRNLDRLDLSVGITSGGAQALADAPGLSRL